VSGDRFTGLETLVTGAGSGIAREVARIIAREGGTVTIWDRDAAAAESAHAELAGISAQPHRWAAVDISDGQSVAIAAEGLRAQAPHTDVLINAAAIAAPGPITGAFLEMAESQWRPLIEVNFIGHVRVMQAVLPGMLDLPSGASVVNVISDSYLGGDRNLAMYGAGKAALASLTKTLARELGPKGVRVNGVSPSATATPSTAEWLEKYSDRIVKMYPLGRIGNTADQANAIVFMASKEADWITGQILSVNGGFI
jgi:NAD(P)-dependent dehydrogenase (short-subunit alcohol dehydrogenase family)